MTARERRLEAAVCRLEKQLATAERHREWYFWRWLLANKLEAGLARCVADYVKKHHLKPHEYGPSIAP